MKKASIKKNYVYNMLYQLLAIIVPIITTPYLARTIGSTGCGIYGYTVSIVTYFALFGSLGVSMYGQREIAYTRDSEKERSKYFYEIILFRFITMLVSILIFVGVFAIKNTYAIYYRILILELFASVIDITWFFQGLEDFKKTVVRNSIVKIIGLICIFTFIKNPSHTWVYILIYAGTTFFGNLTLWFYLPKYIVKVPFKELSIKRNIKPIISLFIPQVAIQIYTLLDKTMIGVITNNMDEVGNYEQSQRIIKATLIVVTALGTVVIPRIANSIANKDYKDVELRINRSYNYMWFIALPLTLGIISCSSMIVPWFLGKGFEKSVILMEIGALLLIAIGLNNITGMQYLIPAKKQNLFTKSVCIAAVSNFCINLILIPMYKSVGAIVASVLAESLIVVIQYIDVKKYIKIKMFDLEMMKCLVSGLIMFAVVMSAKTYFDPTLIETLILAAIGAAVYFACLLALRHKLLFEMINMVLNKLKHKHA